MPKKGVKLKGRPDIRDKERERYARYRASLLLYIEALDRWADSGFGVDAYTHLVRVKAKTYSARANLYSFVNPIIRALEPRFTAQTCRSPNGRHATTELFEGAQKPV